MSIVCAVKPRVLLRVAAALVATLLLGVGLSNARGDGSDNDFAQRPSNLDESNELYTIGNRLAEHKRWDEAAHHWRAALSLNPKHATAWQNLGVLSSYRRDFATAVHSYRRALVLHGDGAERARTHSNIGVALWELGRVEEALMAYAGALQDHPAYAPTYINVGMLLKANPLLRLRYNLRWSYENYFAHSKTLLSRQHRGSHLILLEVEHWDKGTTHLTPVVVAEPFPGETGSMYGQKFPFSLPNRAGPPSTFLCAPSELPELNTMLYKDRMLILAELRHVAVHGEWGVLADDIEGNSTAPRRVFLRFSDKVPPFHHFFDQGSGDDFFEPQPQPSSHSTQANTPTAKHLNVTSAVSVLQRWGSNFYHWLLECVPRLVVLMRAGALLPRACNRSNCQTGSSCEGEMVHLLVPGSRVARKFVDDALDILNIPQHRCIRVVYMVDGVTVHAQRLVTVDWYYDSHYPPPAYATDPINRPGLETAAPRAALQVSPSELPTEFTL
jgi:hypothetical protein